MTESKEPEGPDDTAPADDPETGASPGFGRVVAAAEDLLTPDEGMEAASRPGSMLAGFHGHPVHPILAAVAIGAFVGSFAFDIGSFVADQAWAYAKVAYVLVGFGVVAGGLAAMAGLMDLVRVPRGTEAFRTGIRHLLLMDATLGLFAVSFLLRRGSAFGVDDPVGTAPFVLSVAGIATVALGAWFGLRLAYTHGVRVRVGHLRLEGFEPTDR